MRAWKTARPLLGQFDAEEFEAILQQGDAGAEQAFQPMRTNRPPRRCAAGSIMTGFSDGRSAGRR
jgi:hypothetical protein